MDGLNRVKCLIFILLMNIIYLYVIFNKIINCMILNECICKLISFLLKLFFFDV